MAKDGMVKKLFTMDPASQQSILLAFLCVVAFAASTIPRNERALFIMGNPVGAFAATPETPALDGPQGPIAGFIRHIMGGRGGPGRPFPGNFLTVPPLGGLPGGLSPFGGPAGQTNPGSLPGVGPGDGLAPGGPFGDDGSTAGGGGPGGPGGPIGSLPGGDVGSIPRTGTLPPPPVGPVPEPEAWVLLLAGAFMTAAQLRRARRQRLEAIAA
jgi:hypothetical protein